MKREEADEEETGMTDQINTHNKELLCIAKEYRSLLKACLSDHMENAHKESCMKAIARVDAVLNEIISEQK